MSNALELKVIFAAVDRFVRPVKAITGSASEAAKALRENTARMKEFNRTVEQIDAFKKVERDAAITANTFKATRGRIDELKTAMDKVGVPTKAMADEMAKLTRQSAELKAKHESLLNTEQKLFQKLKDAGIDTRNLAEHRRQLASANAEATNSSRKLTDALAAENQKMKRLHAARANLAKSKELGGKIAGAGAGMMAGGAAINAAAAIPVVAYANAEDAQTQLRIAMMQKNGQVSDQFKEIDALAGKLGNKLPGTTADFQNMMTMLIRQGMPANALLGGLGEATAYLGVQLKMAPEAAAEFSSKLQDATRSADKDMMGLMDTIQRMFYLGVDQNNMLEAFKGLGPAMDLIKRQGLEGTKALAPFVVMMDQAGMRGESAGNAIRKVIASGLNVDKIKIIQDDLKKSKGISLNLDFTDGKGEFGGIEKLMTELSKLKKFDTVTRLAILKDIYGDDKENNEVLSKIIEKGTAGYAEVQAKMANQANIQERVNAQLGTLKSLWDAATGTFTNALVAFGESISPELHATAEWLGKVAERTQAWAKENPKLSGTLMSTFKWLGLAALAIGGIALAAGSIIVPLAVMKFSLDTLGISGEQTGGKFRFIGQAIDLIKSKVIGIASRAMPMLIGTFSSLSTVLAATPLGWVIAGVALLAAAGVLVYKNWEPIKAFFSGFWDGLSEAAGPALSELWANFKKLMASIGELLSLIPGWDAVIVPVFKVIAGGIEEVFNWLGKLIEPTEGTTKAAGEMGKRFGLAAGDIIASLVGLPAEMMKAGANMIDGWIAGILSRWDALKGKMTQLAESLPLWVKKALDIRSPSRVFSEIGMYTMAGLEQGIAGNENGPLSAIGATAKKLAAIGAGISLGASGGAFANQTSAAESPANRPLPAVTASASSGNTYHITIQATAGTDNHDLASLVAREIERIESSKAAQRRSRLRDTE